MNIKKFTYFPLCNFFNKHIFPVSPLFTRILTEFTNVSIVCIQCFIHIQYFHYRHTGEMSCEWRNGCVLIDMKFFPIFWYSGFKCTSQFIILHNAIEKCSSELKGNAICSFISWYSLYFLFPETISDFRAFKFRFGALVVLLECHGVNFINFFTRSFYARRSHKAQKAPWLDCLFCALGICMRIRCT